MDNKKVESALLHAAAEFINRESNRRSLITVTRAEIGDKRGHLIIYITIYPENQAAAALDFLSRVHEDFRDFVKKKIKIRSIPYVTFQQDPNIGGVGEPVPIE